MLQKRHARQQNYHQHEGYRGGKVRISHAQNSEAAIAIERALRERFPLADIKTRLCGGLCSYYAERGGVIVGFETE